MPLREAEALGDSNARREDSGGEAAVASGQDEVHPGVECDGCDHFPITGAAAAALCVCKGANALSMLLTRRRY